MSVALPHAPMVTHAYQRSSSQCTVLYNRLSS